MHLLVNGFKSLCFHLSSHTTERFQNASLLNLLTKVSVFITIYGRSGTVDKQKRKKLCQFKLKRLVGVHVQL